MPEAIDLKVLQSEGRNHSSLNIDLVSTNELCRIINDEDQTVASAVQKCLPTIAQAIDGLTHAVRAGGKVVYVGAGTSGR
jgi:N-acetylmuramic acid 6-phosphate etherase